MKRNLSELVLIGLTVIWGATFFTVSQALHVIGPVALMLGRFALGAAILGLIGWKSLRGMRKAELAAGLLIGAVVFGGFLAQTLALKYCSSSQIGFITALYVPLVPLVELVIMRRAPSLYAWAGTAVSLVGLALLSMRGGFSFVLGPGELLGLVGAGAFALQIVLIGKYAPTANAVRLSFVQLATVALLSLGAMPAFHETLPRYSPMAAGVVIGLGVFATALTGWGMNWAQQRVSATRATLIYAMEPVWAGIIGVAFGEKLLPSGIAGGCLILVGMIIGNWQPKPRLLEACPDLALAEAA